MTNRKPKILRCAVGLTLAVLLLGVASRTCSAQSNSVTFTQSGVGAQPVVYDVQIPPHCRLLSQSGAASAIPDNRLNLNFDNAGVGVSAPWSPLRFFTNVAQALIDSNIETNIFFDSHYPAGANGLGRYITNYYLGGATDSADTNRRTLIGGETRSWNGTSWSPVSREIYYNQHQADRRTNYVNDHTLKLTNITVYPFNQYTPVVHRLVQVAANLHETAGNSREWVTNRTYGVGDMVRRQGRYYRSTAANNLGQDPVTAALVWTSDDPGLPHIFRPVFRYNHAFNSIYISEWLEVTNASWSSNVTYLDASVLTDRLVLSNATANPSVGNTPYDFTLKGFPLIVGMKGPTRNTSSANQELIGGGIPNFNEVSFKTLMSLSRKLRFTKTNRNSIRPSFVDTMFVLGLRTGIGAEAWNPSRFFSYPRGLRIHVTNHMSIRIENNPTSPPLYADTVTFSDVREIAPNSWAPAAGAVEWNAVSPWSHPSFQTLLGEYNVVIPESIYYPPAYSNSPGVGPSGSILPVSSGTNVFLGANVFAALDLKLVISNWFTYVAIDTNYNRVVDYVNLTNLTGEIDLGRLLKETGPFSVMGGRVGRYFQTNLVTGAILTDPMPEGIHNQIYTSLNRNYQTNADWRLFAPTVVNPGASITQFRRFVGLEAAPFGNVATQMFAPFSPTILLEQDLSFEVNDPLVHHLTYQLVSSTRQNQSTNVDLVSGSLMPIDLDDPQLLRNVFGLPGSIGSLNVNYRPWGGNPGKFWGLSGMREHFNMGLKDPAIFFADDWGFPERKFDSIGWAGRVHRGTPWQSIYLKSRVASPSEWSDWEGDPGTHATNDWKLFDRLNAHLGPDPGQGRVGINETNLADWSAVLGDLNFVYNPKPHEAFQLAPELLATNLSPSSDVIRRIHDGILLSRRERTNFTRLGEILSVPELSDGSPFIVRDRPRYDDNSTYLPHSQVVHRGIRWTCVAGAGAARDERPPSFREHAIPYYIYTTLTNRVHPPGLIRMDHPFEKNDYIWYWDASVGVRLYRCTETTINPPITAGALNPGWMPSPWREAQQNPTTAEMLGMSDPLLEGVPQQLMGLLRRNPPEVIDSFGSGEPISGVLHLSYDFTNIPNSMKVYLGANQTPANLIYSSGTTNGTNNVAIPFGPTTETLIRIVINESGGLPGSSWVYTGWFSNAVSGPDICAKSSAGPAEQIDDHLIPLPVGASPEQTVSGTLNLDYDFLNIPDSMNVYLGTSQTAQNLLSSIDQADGSNSVSVPFGPTTNRVIRIVMNEGSGLAGTLWNYVGTFSGIIVSPPGGGGTNSPGANAIVEFTQPRFVSTPGDTHLTIFLKRTPTHLPAQVSLETALGWPRYARLNQDYGALPSAISWTTGDPEIKAVDVMLMHPSNSAPVALLQVGLSQVSSNAMLGSNPRTDVVIRRSVQTTSYVSPQAVPVSAAGGVWMDGSTNVPPMRVFAGKIGTQESRNWFRFRAPELEPYGRLIGGSLSRETEVVSPAGATLWFYHLRSVATQSLAPPLSDADGQLLFAEIGGGQLLSESDPLEPLDNRQFISLLSSQVIQWATNTGSDMVIGGHIHGFTGLAAKIGVYDWTFGFPWYQLPTLYLEYEHSLPALDDLLPARRELPAGYLAGQAVSVAIQASPPIGAQTYVVEDQLPAGWTAGTVSDGGVFDVANHKVKFGPFNGATSRRLHYTARSTTNSIGPAQFGGVMSIDGSDFSIGGDALLPLLTEHPADNNPFDWRMSFSEVSAYGAAWRRGDPWPDGPSTIPMDYVTGAAWLWRGGETYELNQAATNRGFIWIPSALSASTLSPGSSAATSVAPGGFQTGRGLTVNLLVSPSDGVSAWAAVEEVPSGWTATGISDGGVFDARSGEIRWGPFLEGQSRNLSYTLFMGGQARTGVLRGTVSFDGRSIAIAGRRLVSRGSWITANREQASSLQSSGYKVRWRGHPSRTPFVEYTDDLRTWRLLPNNGIQPAGDELELSDPGSPGRAVRFYRIREE